MTTDTDPITEDQAAEIRAEHKAAHYSPLDLAVDHARADYDKLLTQVDGLTDDATRSHHWTLIAAAEQRCADARNARGDIGDYLAAQELSDMVAHSLSMAASYDGFSKAVTS